MTNAEAIETLRVNYPDACYEQLREAVDAAIEALKAQDAAGDTISRQAAIDKCNDHIRQIYNSYEASQRLLDESDREYLSSLITAKNIINSIPSAEPEIVRCKDCKHFHENVWGDEIGHPDTPIILGHEMCDFWGNGCKTLADAFCSFADMRGE